MNPSPSSTGNPADPSSTAERKRQLREHLLARRRDRVASSSPSEEQVWTRHLLELVAHTDRSRGVQAAEAGRLDPTAPEALTVAAYLPTAWEPPLRAGLAALVARGHRVLAPISLPGHRLDWALWTPDTPERRTRFGVMEPEGPRLGAETFRDAPLRVVPALAVGADGVRLGYGGGFYDVALAAGGSGRTVGVVFREELLPADMVPAEPHDARLREVLTEEGLWRPDGSPPAHH